MRVVRDLPSRPRTTSNFFKLVLLAILAGAAISLFVFAKSIGGEDERETRNFGGMTCVYNKTLDEIEACSDG